MSRYAIFMLVIATVLSGCATLSKSECQVANWQAIGYTDGTQGRYPDYVMQHAKACGKIDILPDTKAWESGRQKGLTQYCTPANAYQLGTKGKTLNAVCPTHQLSTLTAAHEQGQDIYHTKKEIEKIKQQISEHQSALNKLLDDYKKLGNGDNLHFNTEKEARQYMMRIPNEIRQLQHKISIQQNTLEQLTNYLNQTKSFYFMP